MSIDITYQYDEEYAMKMIESESSDTLENMTVIEISHPNYNQEKFNRQYGYKDVKKGSG
jgi:hypothetical protein